MKINQIGLSRLAAKKIQQTEVLMKTRSFLLAAGVLLAMSFTLSCDSGGGGGNNPGGGSGSGLTITGLPSGIWIVLVYPAGTDISNETAFDMSGGKEEATNYGGNSGDFYPLLRADMSGSPWTGSGSRPVAIISVGGTAVYWATANFTNGSATVLFSDFTVVEGMGGGGQGGGGGGKSSSSGGGGSSSSSFVPIGKGNNISSYRTVKIGDQTWMAENLNYTVPGSRCYRNNQANCDEYGQFYDWATAMGLDPSCNSTSCASQIQSPHRGICPSGWHIPSYADWYELLSGNSDVRGFSALPVGYGVSDGRFYGFGENGYWWSTSESEDVYYYAYYQYMLYDDRTGFSKSHLFSVRCVQDNTGGGGNSSSSSSGGNPGGNVSSCPVSAVSNNSVTCGGQTYRTVQIGTQTWMAENLNYNVAGSKCYGEDGQHVSDGGNHITLSDSEIQANCTKYGRLYDWYTAKTACPNGWHLPSDADWDVLVDHAGGSLTAGTKLKATSGWNSNGNGTDQYEFSALPGGRGDSYGFFYDVGLFGILWSASEYDSSSAYYRQIAYVGEIGYWMNYDKNFLLSVRCVQD